MLQFTSYVDDDGKLTAIGERVVANHVGLANKLSHAFAAKHSMSFKDLSGAAHLGLMRAIRTFDPTRGFTFATYANHWVACFLRDEARRARSIVRMPRPVKGATKQSAHGDISLDAPLGEDRLTTRGDLVADTTPGPDVEIATADEAWRRLHAFRSALSSLTDREREIVEARHGELSPSPLSILAGKFNISVERVRQIEAKALDKIGKHTRGNAVRARAPTDAKRLPPPKDELVTRHQLAGAVKVTLRHAVTGHFGYADPIPNEFDARMRAKIARTQKRIEVEEAERRTRRMRAIAAGLSWAVPQ